jgi:hypothetical protein
MGRASRPFGSLVFVKDHECSMRVAGLPPRSCQSEAGDRGGWAPTLIPTRGESGSFLQITLQGALEDHNLSLRVTLEREEEHDEESEHRESDEEANRNNLFNRFCRGESSYRSPVGRVTRTTGSQTVVAYRHGQRLT